MSSPTITKSIAIGNGENGRNFTVNRKQAESLAEYVQRVRREKGLSLSDVQRGSNNQIVSSYVSKIENGYADADGVTPKKLQALAKGLGISEDEIFAVARGESATPRKPLTPVDLPPEIAADVELLVSMFLDVPRECQLDTLASLAGVRARRSESLKIYERHHARSQARAEISKQANEILQMSAERHLEGVAGGKDRPRKIHPLPPREVLQLAREGLVSPHEILGFTRTLSPEELSTFIQELSPDELSQFGLDQLLNQSEAENPPRLKTG